MNLMELAEDVEPKRNITEEENNLITNVDFCLLENKRHARTEQHALQAKTYCDWVNSVKLAKYICILKVRKLARHAGGYTIYHKPVH